ncbi:hypothetical protein [uncultured Clostridium sp.]|jgi:hypothetical protein|uniref:hypothetical protein n=1 Tax=uncultured Clostridium sp. TaxID=59620 RepID=UPI00261AE213|nr:hypothetical protein [uncultured Clostridium sp.]
MERFLEKSDNFVGKITEPKSKKTIIPLTSIITVSAFIALTGLCFYRFFQKTETIKTNNNIIIHTTKLED